MGGVSIGEGARSTVLVPSGLAADRLLWLQELLLRQRAVEQMLHGQQREQAHALLTRAIFSLYLDCREAGVGEDAQRLIAGATQARGSVGTPAAGGPAHRAPLQPCHRLRTGWRDCNERDHVASAGP